jgi:GNAT superfamily N-acetyltransferase
MSAMELRQVSLDDPKVAPLLASMADLYLTLYGVNDEMERTVAPEFAPPSGCFMILLHGQITVAGGGFRRVDGQTCEIKRMWTHSSYRQQGHAERLLEHLTDQARRSGYTRLILETGPRQPEAASLYGKLGYQRIPVYGIYPEALAFAINLGTSEASTR